MASGLARSFPLQAANAPTGSFLRCLLSNLLYRPMLKAALVLGMLLAIARVAPAQALEAGERGAEIAPFAQYTMVTPDWGDDHDFGYTVGVDYTRFIRSILQPSLELRMTRATGSTVGEKTYTGGLKLQTTIHRIRPYITLLAGKGFITFDHPVYPNYLGDDSFIFSVGAGALLPVGHHVDLRLDFTHQNWNIGPQTLTPVNLGVGIAYRIPFHKGRSD
jgi:hypothetical protein